MRHTMGQDWGGRRKENPPNAPRITSCEVTEFAQQNDIETRREGLGMWFYLKDSIWYTLGQTNYLALTHLTRLILDRLNEREEMR